MHYRRGSFRRGIRSRAADCLPAGLLRLRTDSNLPVLSRRPLNGSDREISGFSAANLVHLRKFFVSWLVGNISQTVSVKSAEKSTASLPDQISQTSPVKSGSRSAIRVNRLLPHAEQRLHTPRYQSSSLNKTKYSNHRYRQTP